MMNMEMYRPSLPAYTGDVDRDAALTVVEYMLSPEVPPSERKFL